MSAVLPAPLAIGTPWRRALPGFALALLAVLLLYRASFAGMVEIWSRSDTFAHAFLVPPIVLWMVWRRRAALASLQPRPQPWALPALALVGLAWLVGDIAGVNALTQFAATALLVLLVPALLGIAVTRALLFPLCFLFFMVPFGEFVMPTLMQWTADVTIFVLRAAGLPVYREGLHFVIPSGSWSVIEACSGVRYLIASFMVGTLFAYLNYRSPWRRFAFGVVSLLVPIAANWARAVMIVSLGHLSDNKLAAGVDHLIYGWLFFGLVIGLMFFIGSRWAEAPADELPGAAMPAAAAGTAPRPALRAAPESATSALNAALAAAAVAVLALPQAAAWHFDTARTSAPQLVLPALGQPASDAPPLHRPHAEGAKAEAVRVYGSGAQAVTVHVAYYRHQTYGNKLVSSNNQLVQSQDKDWNLTARGLHEVQVPGIGSVPVRSAELRGTPLPGATLPRRVLALQTYWVGGRLTRSDPAAAIYAVAHQLSGRGDDAAAITFYQAAGSDAETRPALLDAFMRNTWRPSSLRWTPCSSSADAHGPFHHPPAHAHACRRQTF